MNPIQEVYNYLARESAKPEYRYSSPVFRPSEIGGCWREIYHRLHGDEPRPVGPAKRLLMLDGDVHHNVVRQLMREAGVKIGDVVFEDSGEVRETGKARRAIPVEVGGKTYSVTMSGRIDGTLLELNNGTLMEIKSVGKYKFDEFQRAFLKGGEARVVQLLRDEDLKRPGARKAPRHAHRRFWLQFQATMLLTDRAELCLVLKNRDTGEIGLAAEDGTRHGIIVPGDACARAEVLERCAVVLRALETNTPPSQEFADGSAPCNWCRYYKHCWGKT